MNSIIKKIDLSPLGVRSINQKLSQVLLSANDLQIGPIRLRPIITHLDQGAYPTGTTHSWHAHSEIHLQICVNGRFKIGTSGENTTETILKPGHIWIIAPAIEHQWTCLDRGILVGVHIQIVTPITQKFKSLIEEHWSDKLLVLTNKKYRQDLIELLQTINQCELWWLDKAAMNYKNWLILLLEDTLPLKEFYQQLPAKEIKTDNHGQRYYQLACEYMSYNLHRKIRLANVASNLGISVRHLSRIFQDFSNTTCNDWLVSRRLKNARTMLMENPDMPIKTICYKVGFDKPAYFSKVFKEHFKVSPSQLKKDLQIDNSI